MSDQSTTSSFGLVGAVIFGLIAWFLWGFPTGAIIFVLAFIAFDILPLFGYIPIIGEIVYYFAFVWVQDQLLPLVHFHAGGWTTGLIFWFGMISTIWTTIVLLIILGVAKND